MASKKMKLVHERKVVSVQPDSRMPVAMRSFMPSAGMEHYGHFAEERALRDGHNVSAHPGFKAVAKSIAQREGYSEERAAAILASRTRHASASAKRKNPRLNRVKG